MLFAYGVLLMPNRNSRRAQKVARFIVLPTMGLEGTPQDTITGDHRAYQRLCRKTCREKALHSSFRPQNPYQRQWTDFRTLQRKSYSAGKTLFFSIIGASARTTYSLPEGPFPTWIPNRICVLRACRTERKIGPCDYRPCLRRICSSVDWFADFNDMGLLEKCINPSSPYSYIGTGEYEIEFGLGKENSLRRNAALIAPRPFHAVRTRHFPTAFRTDGPSRQEFAKVRFLYQGKDLENERAMRIGFLRDGPHTINGKGTFVFFLERTWQAVAGPFLWRPRREPTV